MKNKIFLGIQFILNEDENGFHLNIINGNYEIYKIYTTGKEFVGISALRDPFWEFPFFHLCENQRYSVTFYNESYTKDAMPDWITGNITNTLIGYSRIYNLFKQSDDSVIYHPLPTQDFTYQNRIFYRPVGLAILAYYTDENTLTFNLTSDSLQNYCAYPFTFDDNGSFFKHAGFFRTIRFKGDIFFYSEYKYNFPNIDLVRFNVLLMDQTISS